MLMQLKKKSVPFSAVFMERISGLGDDFGFNSISPTIYTMM